MVPVIQDGEFVMWESNAICRYLAGKQPRGTLLPQEPEARAPGRAVDGLAGHRAQQRLALLLLRAGAQQSRAHRIRAPSRASVESWNRCMRMLDEHFAHGGQFITGEFFTLADVVLGLSTHRWLLSPIERPHLDAVHGYYQRLSVRPAFRAQCTRTCREGVAAYARDGADGLWRVRRQARKVLISNT